MGPWGVIPQPVVDAGAFQPDCEDEPMAEALTQYLASFAVPGTEGLGLGERILRAASSRLRNTRREPGLGVDGLRL